VEDEMAKQEKGKKQKLVHAPITVTIFEEGIDVTSEPKTGKGSTDTFELYEEIANVYFYEEGDKNKKVAKFKEEVQIEVEMDQDVKDMADAKKKEYDELVLAYWKTDVDAEGNKTAEGDWVVFKKQKYFEFDGKTFVIVRLKDWIEDPPVGWGSPT
jgi:hypothetical protein